MISTASSLKGNDFFSYYHTSPNSPNLDELEKAKMTRTCTLEASLITDSSMTMSI